MPTTSRFAELVTSGSLGRRMGARVKRFAPTGVDVELLDVLDIALRSRVPLAVVMPLGGAPVPLTVGVAALLRALLNRGRPDVRVAVCSTRFGDRQLYDQLTLPGQRLADTIPRVRIATDGQITVIGAPAGDRGGRFFLAGHFERISPMLDTLEGVVLDAGSVSLAELRELLRRGRTQMPVVYTTNDPADRTLEVVRAGGGVVWAWDAPTLAALATLPAGPVAASPPARAGSARTSLAKEGSALLADPSLLLTAGYSTVAVHLQTRSSDLDAALAELWTALGGLARAHAGRDDRASVASIQWAWGVFNTLALLPVSASAHDRVAGNNPYAISLTGAPDLARRYAHNATGARRDAWQHVAAALRATVSATAHNIRTDLLCDWVSEASAAGIDAVIGVRNRAAATALRAALRESPRTPLGWDERISVAALTSIARSTRAWDELCLAGTVPRFHAALLAAPPAGTVTVLTCGPAEGTRAVRTASAARTALAALRAETITTSAPQLGVAARCSDIDVNPNAVITVFEDDIERDVTAEEIFAGGNPWDPFSVDVIAILTALPGGGDSSPPSRPGATEDEPVAAIAVYLDEPSGERAVLLCDPNDIVTRRQGSTIARVAAKALAAGDTVVLVDRAARRDLREEITGKLAERGEYTALTTMIDLWHDRAASAGATSGMTYREILAAMPGTSITSPDTIGTWIRADVDGPLDGADVTRFARAVGDKDLERYARPVVSALRTLHSVNRKLGHWLAAKVAATASADRPVTGNDLIDAELNVHVADLLESVTDHVVVDVDARPGQFAPAGSLGLLLPARAAEDLLRAGGSSS